MARGSAFWLCCNNCNTYNTTSEYGGNLVMQLAATASSQPFIALHSSTHVRLCIFFQSNCIFWCCTRVPKASSYAVGYVDRKGPFPIGDQIVLSYAVEKGLFQCQLFQPSNPIRTSGRKFRLFRRDVRIGFLDRKSFQPRRTSHHPTKYTITPRTAANTAPMLAWLSLQWCC